MRIIKPSFEIWDQEGGLEGIYKQIERAGRVCYKSEDKITDTSAKDFVDRMIKSGHGAMLEHGTIYLILPVGYVQGGYGLEESTVTKKYRENSYSKVTYQDFGDSQRAYVTTNYRVIIENDWLMDLDYQCEPTEFHEKRVTVKFVCDRGVSHEFVRHRAFSFAQESTRYCNYSKDKFNNCVTYILPNWCTNVNTEDYERNPKLMYNANGSLSDNEISFLCGLYDTETRYLRLLESGWTPQQARAILPNSLKTELVMTGFTKDWEHFFKLRDAGSAHPQARELAQPLHEEFIERNYIV
jgi:thymidylate synthase (FAD)